MAISEIEKLERRFAENPQGSGFVPLAEAYRKSGDPQRALGILQPGLELHPDYVPASIVLGRCHLDLSRDADAEAAFAHVVALDPENVIALKALADIAERSHRFADSATHLRQLLEVDRSNDGAQLQLSRVLAAQEQFGALDEPSELGDAPFLLEGNSAAFDEAPVAEPAEVPEPTDAAAPSTEAELVIEPTHHEESAPFLADAPLETSAEPPSWPPMAHEDERAPADLTPVADVPERPEADSIFGRLLPEPPEATEDLAVVQLGGTEELVLEGREQSEFQLPSVAEHLADGERAPTTESLASEYQLPDASADLIVLDASATPSEFQTPDASSSLLDAAATEPVPEAHTEHVSFAADSTTPGDISSIESSMLAETPGELAVEEPAGEWVTWSDAALDEDAEPFEEPEAPMPAAAEMPATSEPAAVMEAPPIVAEAPAAEREAPAVEADVEPDLVVTESMAELFVRQGHAGDALRIYRELAGRRPGDARLVARIAELETVAASVRAPSTPYAARVSGGTSVRDVMRSILAARPGERLQAAPVPAAENPSRPSEPTRPAQDSISLSDVFGDEDAASPPAYRAPRPPAGDKGVSFDEFFGAPAEPQASSVRPRGPRPPADDLDQFHSWLQNLKR